MREKRQFEVIESRQMDHLRVFHDVARSLTSSLELEEILTTIMQKMASFFAPERWSLLIVEEDTQELYYAIAVGENVESLKALRVSMGEGVAGWVASTGHPLVVPDVSLDPHWAGFARKHPDLNIQSIACLPCRAEGRTLGVIQLLNSKLDLLSEYSISFLRILCDYAAIAIRNARAMETIHELSKRDDCTGLYNARHLYRLLDEQIAPSADVHRAARFSVVFLDLDHFKQVNDTHGHPSGSRVLVEVGALLKRGFSASTSIFRYGGDEFVVLMADVGKEAAAQAAIRLCEEFRRSRFLEAEGLSLSVLASFGVATFPEDGDTATDILRAADLMMYEAKASTRNNVAVAGRGLVMEWPAAPAQSASRTAPPPRPDLRSELHLA